MILIQVLMGLSRNILSGKPSRRHGAREYRSANSTRCKNPVYRHTVINPALLLDQDGENELTRDLEDVVKPSKGTSINRTSFESPTKTPSKSPPKSPSDAGPRRWVFNMAHLVLGVATWATALAANYSGVQRMQVCAHALCFLDQ